MVEMENVTIAPLTRTFQELVSSSYLIFSPTSELDFLSPNPPGEWKRHIHPEGALYYYDEDKVRLMQRYMKWPPD